MADEPRDEHDREHTPARATSDESEATVGSDPTRRFTLVLLATIALGLLWHLTADRITPSTSQARVSGYVTPIAAQVSGVVTAVEVGVNQRVAAGDVLVQIDRERFELAVEQAEAKVGEAGQQIGADTGGVAAAEARLAEAKTGLEFERHDAQLVYALERQGVASKRRADRSRARVGEADARFAEARAELEIARSQLSPEVSENPGLRSALTTLRQARLDLERSTLRAPQDGGVTNVRTGVGSYANAGQPIMTFISATDVWVEAHLRENSLGRIEPGDAAEIVLDIAPGRVFPAVVASIGFGVKWSQGSEPGRLPTISAPRDWLREPQRFPVLLRFSDDAARGLRREGAQADVIIYTGDHSVLNALGALWIRTMSLLSYFY